MSWRPARSLDVLLDEVNAAAPDRDKASDGTIGDPNHSSRLSDHNPNPAGVVRARDIDHDPAGGCDADVLAEAIRQLGLRNAHPALGPGAYVIWNGHIASDTDDGQPWDWEPYSGSNPHDKHCHVSVATAAAGYDSTAPWGVMEEDDMFSDQDRTNLQAALTAAQKAEAAAKAAKARVDKMGTNLKADRANDKALRRALTEVGVDVYKILARVTELDAEDDPS